MTRNDYTELQAIIQTIIAPLIEKLRELDTKVDRLSENNVTRGDIEKLSSNFISREYYNTRHDQLIERDLDLEKMIRDMEIKKQLDLQKIYEKIEEHRQQAEARAQNQHQAQLSQQDRQWIRISQLIGVVAIIITILSFFLQHVRFA